MEQEYAWVIMGNDFPESVALSESGAEQEVKRVKEMHDEPEDGRYPRRYIRAMKVKLVRE